MTAVVVAYGDPDGVRRGVAALAAQTAPPAEILLVDNHPDGQTAAAAEGWDVPVRVVARGRNVGFAAGCNLAARAARGDWLFFCNPDAVAEADCLERLLAAAAEPGVAVVGAQVLLGDGTTNAGDNPMHLTGLSWSGRFGEPAEHGPARDTAGVSGAALMARRETFTALGGFCEPFFMYYEDADLCWRARLAGHRVRFAPDARVVHDYEFDKGTTKYFLLERNRAWAQLANLSGRGLLLLAPVLAATELATLALAVRQGWLREKLRAWGALWAARHELRAWRRRVQATRAVSDGAILARHTGRIDTPLVAVPARRLVGGALELWRRTIVALLA